MNPIDEGPRAKLFFERLMESLPDHVYFKDREGRFTAINKAQALYIGLSSPEEAIGKTDYDFFEASEAREKDADEREIVRSGIGFIDKEELATSIGGAHRWVLSSKLPLFGEDGEIIGTFGISREITEMKEARESLKEQHRLLKTLIEILPCWIMVKNRDGRLRLTNEAYRRAIGAQSPWQVEGRRLEEVTSDPRFSNVAADDRDVLETGRQILGREECSADAAGAKRWMLLSKVPLRDGEGAIQGLVGMAADITAQKEAEARAIRAQQELAAANREIEAELALARELQTEMMASSLRNVRESLDPAAPFHPAIGFHYEPSAHLAGDFFQLVPVSRHGFGLLLCDVMGHGVKAALVTTLVRGLLADLSAEHLRPGEILSRLNARLCPLLDRPPLPRFVTALYARFDTLSGRLEISSAGHPWPLLHTENGNAGPLATRDCGPALGLVADASFATEERHVSPGSRLLFFTDGWTEETSPAHDEFGRERLMHAWSATAGREPGPALQTMAAAVREFSGKHTRSDDLCAVMASFPARRRAPPPLKTAGP
jgi:sigma-B regulation protein RsbU (phosphoserine phosphatase)